MSGRWLRWFSVVPLALVAAGVPGSAHAQIDLPDVDLPTVKLPGVPAVQLPTVQTPEVQLPVPTPELPEVPDVTVPDVTVPDVPAPAPDVTVPEVPPPPVGGSGGGGSGGGGGTSTPGTTGGGGSGGGGGATGGSTRSAPSGGDAGAAAPRERSGGGGAAVPQGGRRVPATPDCDRCAGADARSRPHERRLQRIVARLQECLDAVTATQRRVLVLRAGVGAHDPLSRRAVARRLDTTRRDVRRTERRGVRALTSAARDGRCGGAGGAAGSATIGGMLTAVGDVDPPAGGGGGAGAGGDDDRTVVGGEFRSGPSGIPETATAPGDAARPQIGAGGGDGDTPVLLLVALAFLGGFGVIWTLERRRTPGQPA